ncbi:MAG: hypothetical protein AAF231_10270 [Pseudomonadota bacterium]
MDRLITVSAPGSIMITGEHAVVYGHPAIVAAIDQRITVQLAPEGDALLHITSGIAPPAQVPMGQLVAEGPYRFVIAAVLLHRGEIPSGLRIDITSEIDPTLGLGSSAAVTVAVLAALAGEATAQVHQTALSIIRAQQGRGSGADLAASLQGGALSYQIEGDGPARIAPLSPPPVLSLFNVGYKTPTADVLVSVAKAHDEDPARIDTIYTDMGRVAVQTIGSVERGHWAATGPHLAAYQDLMQQLGVSDDALDGAVARATATDGVIGAKISGSGLGDCVVAIGAVPDGFEPVKLAKEGVVFHGER